MDVPAACEGEEEAFSGDFREWVCCGLRSCFLDGYARRESTDLEGIRSCDLVCSRGREGSEHVAGDLAGESGHWGSGKGLVMGVQFWRETLGWERWFGGGG